MIFGRTLQFGCTFSGRLSNSLCHAERIHDTYIDITVATVQTGPSTIMTMHMTVHRAKFVNPKIFQYQRSYYRKLSIAHCCQF